MRMEKAGWWIAMAAIVVQAPRLVLAVLAADRLPVGAGWESALLVVAGCGTAVVLTGGNLYLMHAVTRTRCWRGGLLVLWLVVLGSTGAMVVPKIAAGFFGRPFTGVLKAEWLGWAWSAVAALAHEVTAAGCVLSAAALAKTAEAAAEERRESAAVAELLSQRDAARREAELLREQVRQSVPAVRLVVPLSLEGSGRGDSGSSGGTELAAVANDSAAAGPAAGGAAEQAAGGRAEVVTCREGCGKQFGSQLAEMGHLRHCPARQERLRRSAAAGS